MSASVADHHDASFNLKQNYVHELTQLPKCYCSISLFIIDVAFLVSIFGLIRCSVNSCLRMLLWCCFCCHLCCYASCFSPSVSCATLQIFFASLLVSCASVSSGRRLFFCRECNFLMSFFELGHFTVFVFPLVTLIFLRG